MTAAGAARRAGLAWRLLASFAVVVASAGAAAAVVTLVVAPRVFHEHMERAGLGPGDLAAVHAEEAYRAATSAAVGGALTAAAATSVLVSVLLARRWSRPLARVAQVARRVGAGAYEHRVPAPGLGPEMDDLVDAVNTMAARLEADDRWRARMVADVAHELRTPAATIRAYVEGVQDGVVALDDDTADVLVAQADRLARLASDLAAVAGAEHRGAPRAAVAPDDLVAVAVRSAAARAVAAGVALSSDVAPRLPAVEVDRERLAQVLDNLLANALRHARGHVHVTASTDGGHVVLRVVDDGDGIAAADLPHVFARFWRGDTARGRDDDGAGLGLALVRSVVRAHGGEVEAASPGPGRGATFTVRLLAAAPRATRPT